MGDEIRNKKGQIVKGSPSLNPSGRKSDALLVRLYKDTFGENLEGLFFLRMALISGREPRFAEIKKFVNLIKNPDVKKKFKKFLRSTGLDKGRHGIRNNFSSLKISDILSILDGIEFRCFGKHTQHNIQEMTGTEPLEINITYGKDEDSS